MPRTTRPTVDADTRAVLSGPEHEAELKAFTERLAAVRVYPPLPANANLQSSDATSTIRIILDGAESITTPRAPNTGSMPAYAAKLSDQQIADVATYIRNAWGNAAPAVTAAEVKKARSK